MEPTQTFFSKVSTRKERERAFSLMVDSKSHIECQFANKSIIELTADHIRDSYMVVFCNQQSIVVPCEIIVTFSIGAEKYFMKTNLKPHDLKSHYTMDLEPALFKLQRRNSFRVQIPPGYHAKIKILKVDDEKYTRPFVMGDLSGGGFSFEMTPDQEFELKKNQIIEAELEIGGKFKKVMIAIVRHIAKIGSQGSGLQKIGLEFQGISAQERDEIIKLVMALHRDMFSKFKIGSR